MLPNLFQCLFLTVVKTIALPEDTTLTLAERQEGIVQILLQQLMQSGIIRGILQHICYIKDYTNIKTFNN